MKTVKITTTPSAVTSFVSFLSERHVAYVYYFGTVYVFSSSTPEKFRDYCETNGVSSRTLKKLEFSTAELDVDHIPNEG